MSSTSQARSLNLDKILDERIDWRYKSFPAGRPTKIRQVGARGWNVLGGDFLLPVMVLKDSALRHNSRLMASYCKRHDFLLAPHGKTSMAPQLLKMQLDDGAWAVTAATMSQVRVWRAFGVERVILANQLVEPASVRWVASELAADPEFEFYCLVDSVAGVRLLESALGDTGLDRRLHVLLELGPVGGRGPAAGRMSRRSRSRRRLPAPATWRLRAWKHSKASSTPRAWPARSRRSTDFCTTCARWSSSWTAQGSSPRRLP